MKTLKVDADSGEISLTDVAADYGELYADMGRITGKDLTSNGLKVESSNGEIELEGNLLGLTDISSDMGRVTVNPGVPRDQLNYELNADKGTVYVGGDRAGGSITSNNGSAKNTLKITTDMGDINVNFD